MIWFYLNTKCQNVMCLTLSCLLKDISAQVDFSAGSMTSLAITLFNFFLTLQVTLNYPQLPFLTSVHIKVFLIQYGYFPFSEAQSIELWHSIRRSRVLPMFFSTRKTLKTLLVRPTWQAELQGYQKSPKSPHFSHL